MEQTNDLEGSELYPFVVSVEIRQHYSLLKHQRQLAFVSVKVLRVLCD
jgi:hypothetical protein